MRPTLLTAIKDVRDAVLAGALAVLTLMAVISGWYGGIGTGDGPVRDADVLAAGLFLLQAVPLAWRRRAPLVVLAVVAAAFGVHHLLDYPPSPADAGLLVALYTVPAERTGRPRIAAAVVALVVVAVDVLAAARNAHALDPGAVVVYAVFLQAFCAAGALVATRRAYVAALELRLADLERLRDYQARQAVAQERSRVARELHDVISHHVSVMVVQADAADLTLDAEPGRARASIRAVATTGRAALAELGRLLGLLRSAEGPGDPPLRPGLAQLGALALRMADAGLGVDVEITGDPVVLPDDVDAAAFLVVREAVTNGLRHGRSGPASVLLDYGEAELDVRITTGGGPGRPGEGSGHGLLGMREHAASVGGRLDAGLHRDHFVVRARLPLGARPGAGAEQVGGA